jgi:hypothetical protein
MQLKKARRKGCVIYTMHVSNLNNREPYLDDYPILMEFQDVFLDELTKLPSKREFNFSIDLVPKVEPQSKAPY